MRTEFPGRTELSGWGRHPVSPSDLYAPRDEDALRRLVTGDGGHPDGAEVTGGTVSAGSTGSAEGMGSSGGTGITDLTRSTDPTGGSDSIGSAGPTGGPGFTGGEGLTGDGTPTGVGGRAGDGETIRGGLIARGNGRAYGDSAAGVRTTLSMRHFNRMLAFDAATGQLVAEAGVLLADILATFLPRGWFPAITPGTKYVTLGGMIAADVHGKNHHHAGCFRNSVDWVDLMGADGRIARVSPGGVPALFDRTLGGMGLTGVILRAAIRLAPVETGWIRQRILPAPDLATAMKIFAREEAAPYSVAWIDCLAQGAGLGRSLVMLGEHARLADLDASRPPFPPVRRQKRGIPVDLPAGLLNRHTVRAFNALHYRAGQGRETPHLVDWDSYFYPLDAVLGWNRIYGRRGFAQFQCVLPDDASKPGLTALLQATAEAGQGSFLAVLKRMGPEARGPEARDSEAVGSEAGEPEARRPEAGGTGGISFPRAGYTLALDFPVNARTLALMERLDRITLDHGGRFYLAKDSRMRAGMLHASDPRATGFAAYRAEAGIAARFRSAQAERLDL